MLNIYTLFGLFVFSAIIIAIYMKKFTKWSLMWRSIVYIIVMVGFSALMVAVNTASGDISMVIMGNVMLVLSSVIGGTLFGTAWNEIKK